MEVIQKTKAVRPRYLACYRIDRVLRTGECGLYRLLNGIHPATLVSVSERLSSQYNLNEIRTCVKYASEEASAISKRTRDSMALIKGDVGRAPIGFRYYHGRLVKDKKVQKTISKIKHLAKKGWSCAHIAESLNRTRSRKVWTPQRVWSVLNYSRSRNSKC